MEALTQVLDEVLDVVSASEQNTSWTERWSTQRQLVLELRAHTDRVRRGDLSTLGEVKFLFLPTGPLQEVAISSGWGERFLDLAKRFDQACEAVP